VRIAEAGGIVIVFGVVGGGIKGMRWVECQENLRICRQVN